MDAKNTIWAVYTTLGTDMWFYNKPSFMFEEEAWEIFVKECHEAGMNMIVLDLGEGVRYESCPEIAHPNAWSKDRVKAEVKRLREMGIALIPKINFSASHDKWLGIYSRMIATPEYYRVCEGIIKDVYEMFEQPEYIHIGMDEEGNLGILDWWPDMEFYAMRRGELFWHDMKFLVDCVTEAGSKAWIWADVVYGMPEEFKKRYAPGSVLISPYSYRAFKEEDFRSIKENEWMYEKYKNTDVEYMEQCWMDTFAREGVVPLTEEGYEVIMTGSCIFDYEDNHRQMVEHYSKQNVNDKFLGFMTAPWLTTTMADIEAIKKNIYDLRDGRDMFWK